MLCGRVPDQVAFGCDSDSWGATAMPVLGDCSRSRPDKVRADPMDSLLKIVNRRASPICTAYRDRLPQLGAGCPFTCFAGQQRTPNQIHSFKKPHSAS